MKRGQTEEIAFVGMDIQLEPKSHRMLIKGPVNIYNRHHEAHKTFKVVYSTADGARDVFHLLPCLMSFEGRNLNGVVILDNCSIHHVEDVVCS